MDDLQSSEDMLARILADPEVQAAGEDETQAQSIQTGGEGLLGALPPDLIGKLPALMSALGPMMGGSLGNGAGKDDKTALLLALKPYMSPQRCDAIDKLIMFGRLGQILQQLR